MKTWNIHNNILLSPDEGAGGGEGGDDEHARLAGEGEGEGEGTGEGEGGKGGEGEGEGAGKPTGLTRDDITDILSRVIPAGAERREPEQPARQYTQAELEQMFNVWKPDSGFLRKLGLGENPTAEQLSALMELRDGIMRQAGTMSKAEIAAIEKKYEDRFAHVEQYISEQTAAKTMDSFYSKYGELGPYEEIVDAVSRKLEESGFKAPTQDKVFEEIARSTHEVLKRMNVKVEKPKAGATGGNGRPASRMAQLSRGGQPGGGGDAGKPKRKEGMAIFDEAD